MSTMLTITLVLIVLGAGLMFLNVYNGLVRLRHQLERAWANIDVILTQRCDEIPQLIQVIEQYASYESDLIKKLAESRQAYGTARSVSEKVHANQEISVALQGVMAIGENYPDLKANQNFTQLQHRVSDLEGMIADRRETYNEAVANFNTRLEQFPDVFVAGFLNYQRQELLRASEKARQAPSLKMNLPRAS